MPKKILNVEIALRVDTINFFGIDLEDTYLSLMASSRIVADFKDVGFDESSTVLENLNEFNTSRINFELPCLNSQYFGDSVLEIVHKATAENQTSLDLILYKNQTILMIKMEIL